MLQFALGKGHSLLGAQRWVRQTLAASPGTTTTPSLVDDDDIEERTAIEGATDERGESLPSDGALPAPPRFAEAARGRLWPRLTPPAGATQAH